MEKTIIDPGLHHVDAQKNGVGAKKLARVIGCFP